MQQDLRADRAGLRHFMPYNLHRAQRVIFDPRRPGNARQRRKRRLDPTMFRQNLVKRHRTDPARTDEAKPKHRILSLGPAVGVGVGGGIGHFEPRLIALSSRCIRVNDR